ncbi:MAG TPA: hypothetical protein VFE36_06190, partial [Candidatus Baltobacteraceae bacterium]|nr:hypothetical protein [Candidatus Baltobacteraceae bacterium]
MRWILALLLAASMLVTPETGSASAQSAANHDFDFLIGAWKTRIRTLGPGGKWIAIDGIVTNRKLWNGKADLEEIEASSSAFEGMTLRLYDPSAKQWNLYWASSDDGNVDVPSVGAFEKGRGTFYSHELIDGVATYVRQVYFDATPTTYKFEQSFSHDAGKTWKPNFEASLTRANPGSVAVYPKASEPLQQHGFD